MTNMKDIILRYLKVQKQKNLEQSQYLDQENQLYQFAKKHVEKMVGRKSKKKRPRSAPKMRPRNMHSVERNRNENKT